MRKTVLLALTLIFLSAFASAGNHSEGGLLEKFPEVEIESSEPALNASSIGEAGKSSSRLLWIIVFGLVLVGAVIYSFDLDPFKIALLLILLGLVLIQVETGFLPIGELI